MNWKNPKNWLLVGGAIIASFAIYTFASPESTLETVASPQPRTTATPRASNAPGAAAETVPGVEPLRIDLLEPESGVYKSGRNLFAYVEPPPPPPPAPPPPPKDSDKDGIPDFQDNCPDTPNPDQSDIDRNGIGAACQEGNEIAPPPPPPQPPAFTYKYLGNFGTPGRQIASFSNNGEIVNVRVGEKFGGRFILLNIGIESVDIGFVGFPPDIKRRVPVGQ